MTTRQATADIMRLIKQGQHEATAEHMRQAYGRKYAEWLKVHLGAARAARALQAARKDIRLSREELVPLALAADFATIDETNLHIELCKLEAAYQRHIDRHHLDHLPYNIYD